MVKECNCKSNRKLLEIQLGNELTESEVYSSLAALESDPHNKEILERISRDEKSHAQVISRILSLQMSPDRRKVATIAFFARIFGLTFSLKLMERGENIAGRKYRSVIAAYPELAKIAEDEERHEKELLDLLKDAHLSNIGSVVLGLNDALVELTGALAGFTFALGNPTKVAKLGFITGMAAAMSMAASAFLSARAEEKASSESSAGDKSALMSALYTGGAYVLTVFILVSPYVFIPNLYGALAGMLLAAFVIIAVFNFYLSVARETSFVRGFLEMAGISTLVASISYVIGYLLG
jgi:VIT1/CCC1 family predicted Fe2+/Mn2+ transporter